MSKLTYRDLPLVLDAGAEPSFSNTGWWLMDNSGVTWYVQENDDNQYLTFSARSPAATPSTMDRERFEELFT